MCKARTTPTPSKACAADLILPGRIPLINCKVFCDKIFEVRAVKSHFIGQ